MLFHPDSGESSLSEPPPPPHITPAGQRDSMRLTRGPIASTLLWFSLPTLASSVMQSLNASINSAWIGNLLGEQALTASANANSLIFLLLGAVFGLGIAATVLVGQSLGAKNLDQAKRTIGTSLSFFGVVSLALAGLGITFASDVLHFMHTPPDALPLAAAYLRVIFIALPGMYLYSFAMMALRGAGDAKTPLVFLFASALIDTGLNPLLIRGFGPIPPLGIAGSAYATLIAQWSSLIALVVTLYRRKHFLRLTGDEMHYLRVDHRVMRALLTKGIPMGLQVIAVSTSMLAMITLVNSYGSRTTAAYGACFQLWNYIQMPAFAIGSAVSSMAAQNVGAGLWDRVTSVARIGVLFNVLLTGTMVLAVTAVSRRAFGIFLGDNPEAIDIAIHIHAIVSWSFILLGASFVLGSVMRATGAVVPPLLIVFASLWLLRIPFAYGLKATWHADSIWWSFPVGSGSSVAMSIVYYRFGRWRSAHMLAPARASERE